MRNVMMMGKLEGTLDLDTLPQTPTLFGLGPEEFLRAELLIDEGVIYRSLVAPDSTMRVEQVQGSIKAPFFVYAQVSEWKSVVLPDSVRDLPKLDLYLDELLKKADAPVAFRLRGQVQQASIHVVNLPEGTQVQSPQDAHVGQQNFNLAQAKVNMIGFYSRNHQGVFTHHDSHVHIHLIDDKKERMGHLDNVLFTADKVTLEVAAVPR